MEMENNFQALVERMKVEMFSSSIDLGSFVSVSAYDTAWLAMIPDPQSPARPMFPQCLDWLLNNQRELGFWGHPNHLDQPFIRECITTTLACIVSLKSWDVGYETINKGLEFIHDNTEKLLIEVEGDSPRWFAIVFPGMVEHAWSRGVDIFPDGSPQIVKSLFNERQQIFEMKEALDHPFYPHLLYYYEALPSIYKVDCMEEVLRHLNQYGSLFQSPSATASALMDTHNKKSQDYLESMVQRCRTGVPPVYPVDEELIKLCMVDRVERLGLDEHFHQEINNVLCDVYSNWTGRDVLIIEDYTSSLQIYKNSLAYRLLTLHGYRVSSSTISLVLNDESKLQLIEKDFDYYLSNMLNVYRALEVTFGMKGEDAQDAKIHLKRILEKTICNGKFRIATNLLAELQIEHELSLPWLTRMDHLEHRECIERGNVNDIWTGKAWYRLSCVNDAKLLSLAKENFTYRQSIYKRELKELEGWARDNGIFDLGFGRNKTSYCYFAMAATIYHPRSHILRTTSAKNGILFTIIDDFFDTKGSMNELTTFTDAVERWDGEVLHGHGKVLFDAINDLVNDTAMLAFPIQGRNVTKHLQDIWCEIIRSWLKEAEWSRRNYTPTIDEYLKVATISVAVQTAVVPTVYLVGPTISEELVNHPDYTKITELLMISTRLLNDLQSYQKEREEGKQNLILLLMQGHSDRMLEHACAYATDVLDQTKEELLEHALMNDKNSIPKSCRKLHFVLLKIFHMFYNSTNVYDSPTELIHSINRAIHVPL